MQLIERQKKIIRKIHKITQEKERKRAGRTNLNEMRLKVISYLIN